jgi:hypothetical protein
MRPGCYWPPFERRPYTRRTSFIATSFDLLGTRKMKPFGLARSSGRPECAQQNVIISLRSQLQRDRSGCAHRVVGEWLSLVEHLVRDQGVGGSNPLSPTILSLAHSTGYAALAISDSSLLRIGNRLLLTDWSAPKGRNAERVKKTSLRACDRKRLAVKRVIGGAVSGEFGVVHITGLAGRLVR